ncbi:MAG: nucleotide exchange factor GrpE [bacterium]|nr:nucleotide exchange factor GrpE [bacterium]
MTKKNEKTKEIEELDNKYKRALADYQNLEKRVREERANWIKTANKELLLRILPVLDTLILANQHAPNEGLKLSIQQFLSALKTEGVEKIEVIGKQFDPITMECIATIEGEEGKVLEEIRFGYKLYDIILRVAQVKVGKGE